ncbi:MAG: endo alpha-1,4 polygalactosaminidase [Hyphomicrobiaceae bacterium]
MIAAAPVWQRHSALAAGPVAVAPAVPAAVSLLRKARSWSYQLQNYDMAALAASPADILVVDYSINGREAARFTEGNVGRLRVKPDGSRRVVLAYLSIGEAEEYRYYWKADWLEQDGDPGARPDGGTDKTTEDKRGDEKREASAKPERWLSPSAPSWLGDENETWSGNFAVRFWDPGWQSIILDGPRSYLSRIIRAGFDGVYLDRVDAFYEHSDERPSAADDMVAFVERLAAAARAQVPGFLVVPQNAEELLVKPHYVALIDAIAKEDLLYGSPVQGKRNSEGLITNSMGWLGHARLADKPVMVVEYLDDAAEIARATRELRASGMIPTFAPRLLDRLSRFAVPG